MIKVHVKKQSNYPVKSTRIKQSLKEFLKEKGIVTDSEVSVALVGKEKAVFLAREYLKERPARAHNVLSFSAAETKGKFIEPPAKRIYLGEIVVCFPIALSEARKEGKLTDEKVIELVEHGALHLLGIHHK